jgi:hypothetical protein
MYFISKYLFSCGRSDQFEENQQLESRSNQGKVQVTLYNTQNNRVGHHLYSALQENPFCVFLFWELRGLSPNFNIHVCERFIQSQEQSTYFPVAE